MPQDTEARDLRQEFVEFLVDNDHDPLTFVDGAYKWGAGDLTDKYIREWQAELLADIRVHLRNPKTRHQPFNLARASGHGIGKSAVVGMVLDWGLSTFPDSRAVITANTETQLRTKTVPEVSKWFNRSITKPMWTVNATSIISTQKGHEKTWRADFIPWSENNTEAFAGLHNEGRRIILIFDEASAIADMVWEVAEGALTDENTEILWFCFGNPTKSTGRFHRCFTRDRHRWHSKHIDSSTVEGTNKTLFADWRKAYGFDSDFYRVRVRGQFPRTGSMQFISGEIVERAKVRSVDVPFGSPKLMGVDVARFGDDATVIARRHGRKVEELHKFRGLDTMETAAVVATLIRETVPDAVFVDGVGIGAGVVDRLNQLGFNVIEVNAGSKPDEENKETHYNKRVEMWDRMRQWLEGADIPDDQELHDDLISPEYGYDNKMRMQLEKKEDMKKRGLASPDCADAIALTFAYKTPPLKVSTSDLIPDEVPDY